MEYISTLPLLPIHLLAVAATLVLVITADTHGILWILGKIQTLPKKRLQRIHVAIWVGLITICASGLGMFLVYQEYLLTQPAFGIKMVFVATLLINACVVGRLAQIAYVYSFRSLPRKKQILLLTSGCVSTIAWIGALIAAQFLGL